MKVLRRAAALSLCALVAMFLVFKSLLVDHFLDDGRPTSIATWNISHVKYTRLFKVNDDVSEFLARENRRRLHIPTFRRLYPSDVRFMPREMGDCVHNGDAERKKLSPTCGCKPAPYGWTDVHPCCRPHLLQLLRDVYKEVMTSSLPLVLIGGGVIGWQRNGKLVPYDLDLDAAFPWELWHSPQFRGVLERLAKGATGSGRRYCVWFREKHWIKIWSSVMAFDIFAFSYVREAIYFKGKKNPHDVSMLLPARKVRLEDVEVFAPQNPVWYLDHTYGVDRWREPLKCTKRDTTGKCVE